MQMVAVLRTQASMSLQLLASESRPQHLLLDQVSGSPPQGIDQVLCHLLQADTAHGPHLGLEISLLEVHSQRGLVRT